MGRKALTYFASLVALYIVVANASNAGTLIDKGAKGGGDFTRVLQGR